jgi:CO dehydrogenase maturation factor
VLSEAFPDKKILAVDADPAVGLSTALQMQPALTLDDIRVQIAENIEEGKTTEAIELLSEAKFHLLDTIIEKDNISFLAIGRPEAAGCYCKVNAYLKQVIEMLCENYDFVVIDGEAGIEQINRRVMENITYLVLVSDGSRKGIQVISAIEDVAKKLTNYKKSGVIFNRTRNTFNADTVTDIPAVLSVIGEDENQTENDMQGESVFNLSSESPLYRGAKKALFSLLEEN